MEANKNNSVDNNQHFQSLQNCSIYVDNVKSNSNDNNINIENSNFSQSRTELLSIDIYDKIISSHMDCVNIHSPNSGIDTPKVSFIDAFDSGISSPTSVLTANLISKPKIASKNDIVYDGLDDQCQSNSEHIKFEARLPKLSICEQSPGGIGGIVSRIRSLSIGMRPRFYSNSRKQTNESSQLLSDPMPSGCVSPDPYSESVNVPNAQSNNSLLITNRNMRPNRKWMRMSHSLSYDVDSVNLNDVPQNMNRLEIFLSGHIDTSTPNGALIAVINHGLRKVSESDRYLLFSKCPLRSSLDFLDSGMEHLGDSDILITVLHHSTCYDLMPESGKLIVLDSALSINKAFVAIEDNNVDSAPIWNSENKSFVGILRKDNQMYFLLLAYQLRETNIDTDTYMRTISRESLSNCIEREPSRHQLQLANPEDTICSVIKHLDVTSSKQVVVIDEQRSGNALYVLDHRRILSFLLSASQYGLPLPSVLKNSVGVTELMMNRTLLEQYKVYPSTNLATLLQVMDNNVQHCAIICRKKVACKRCLCTDECIGLLTVDHISQLISQSGHCDPSYKVESILNQIPQCRKSVTYCRESSPVINIIKSIIEEKSPFIVINQDCCKNCIHSIISSKELLNYIMKHDKYTAVRENTYVPEHRKSYRSFSCCETIQKISEKNISGVSLDEKEEDVFNMEVT